MIRFLQISILVLVLSSCSLSLTKDWTELPSDKVEIVNPYFTDLQTDYIYKAKIAVFKNNFGGILIIKKTGDNSHRVVFTTEFGNTLFDFLYEGGQCTVNHIIEELDKKFIVNTLKQDFKTLVFTSELSEGMFDVGNQTVYKAEDDKRSNFYFFNKKTGNLDQIVNTTSTKEKVAIHFTNHTANEVQLIRVEHKNIQLQINLERFKN